MLATKFPKPMLLNITILIITLVAINFILLKLSVNKPVKHSDLNKKPVILCTKVTTEFEEENLAPTGS